MRLYLVQHGDAVAKEANPDRPLSEKGTRDVQRLAVFLARSGVNVARVLHSGKLRAAETAGLLAKVLGPGDVVEEAVSGLGPKDSTETLAAAIGEWSGAAEPEDVMLVGHLPHMGRLASRLAAGNTDAAVAAFEPGTVLCLEHVEGEDWTILWMAGPRFIGQ